MAIRKRRIAAGGILALCLTSIAPATSAHAGPALEEAFERAAKAYDVPKDLLISIGYSDTRLDMHNGRPSQDNGYGIAHLVRNDSADTLGKAAKLTGKPERALRTKARANILGGAAVLRSIANELRVKEGDGIAGWYPAVAAYSNAKDDRVARLYADMVYENLGRGIKAKGLTVRPRPVRAERGRYADVPEIGAQSEDYPPAKWDLAHSSNYSSGRTQSISAVVIHTTQGSYAGTISWFKNPSSNVSAHYVIRSADGEVTQMVRERDTAWHARSGNPYSVGIEHEGFVDDPAWYTEAMYQSSAALTRHLTEAHNIPRDRGHIVGHNEVPGNDHTDPGPHWDWDKYMALVNGDTDAWNTIVDNGTEDRFSAGASWGTSSYSSQRYSDDYRFTEPTAEDDPAAFKAAIPEDGKYRVEVWYPSLPGYNDVAPYRVRTSGGVQEVFVDQRSGGGSWRSLGEFELSEGDRDLVTVGSKTGGSGYVIADAIRVVAVE